MSVRWIWPERLEPGSPMAKQAAEVCKTLQVPPALGRAFASRGIDSEMAQGLRPLPLAEATQALGEIPGIREASAVLLGMAVRGPIGIVPDYDVDGGTACAIMAETLRAIGARTVVRVPDRDLEGFGPNRRCLEELAAAGCRCVVTLDCGTAEGPLLDAGAKDLELVPIVIDHHPLRGATPPTVGVLVNPHAGVADGGAAEGAMGDLCTAALAWFLGRSLLRDAGLGRTETIQLRKRITAMAALGTVCDVMPLDTPWNRSIVVSGGQAWSSEGVLSPGLAALSEMADMKGEASAADFGWKLGPRINAGSRMGESGLAAACLSEEDPARARVMAVHLEDLNTERKKAVAAQVAALGRGDGPVNVVLAPGGTPGIAGLLASALVRQDGWPALVLCPKPDGSGLAGSGRSSCGFDLGSAVGAAVEAKLLSSGGGHAMACGAGLGSPEGIPALREFMQERFHAERQGETPEMRIDSELRNGCLAPDALLAAAKAESALEPWGNGLERPLYGVRECHVMGGRMTADGAHAFVTLSCEGRSFEAVWWKVPVGWRGSLGGVPSKGRKMLKGLGPCSVAGRIEIDTWQGKHEPRLVIERAKPLSS